MTIEIIVKKMVWFFRFFSVVGEREESLMPSTVVPTLWCLDRSLEWTAEEGREEEFVDLAR